MVQDSDGPELNQFKDSHGSKKDSGIRAGSVRHVLEDFVVVINRTKPVKRPVFRDSDSDHIGDGNQAAIAVILMIAGVGGIARLSPMTNTRPSVTVTENGKALGSTPGRM